MKRKLGWMGWTALLGVVLALVLSLPAQVSAQTTDDTFGGGVLDKDGSQSDRGGPPGPGAPPGDSGDGGGTSEADPNSFDIDAEGDLEFERQDRPERSPRDAWRRFVLLWIATMTRFATFPG